MSEMMNGTTSAHRPVTLRDIAERCGVHITTVSLAIRGIDGRVKPETRARILAAADELGYNPQATHAARRLRLAHTGRHVASNMVAVLFSRVFATKVYDFTLFRAIIETLTAEGYGLVTAFAEDVSEGRLHAILLQREVDGIITLSNTEPLRRAFGSHGDMMPVIRLIQRETAGASVTADDRTGGYLSACHLLELGHRHLLHFHGDHHAPTGQQRLAGYRDACREYGLDPEVHLHRCDDWSPYGQDDEDREWVWAQVSPSLARHPEITGILAANDYVAVQVYEALQQHGRHVPDDYSLVGFDDTHAIHRGDGQNILTSVRVPLAEIGHEAARLLLAIIRDETAPDTSRTLPVELVLRSSVHPV